MSEALYEVTVILVVCRAVIEVIRQRKCLPPPPGLVYYR